jgi:hypothetical protein
VSDYRLIETDPEGVDWMIHAYRRGTPGRWGVLNGSVGVVLLPLELVARWLLRGEWLVRVSRWPSVNPLSSLYVERVKSESAVEPAMQRLAVQLAQGGALGPVQDPGP